MMNHLDTTKPIWEFYYKVKIPYLQSRTETEMKLYGIRLSDVKELDNSVHQEWMTTMLTIAQMLEYYEKGCPVKVVNYNDTKSIYEAISNHIHYWRNKLERGINIGDAPIDDLILMDQFANTVYEHAKYQFTREIVDSLFIRNINDGNRVSTTNFFKPSVLNQLNKSSSNPDGVTRINGSDEQPLEDRESLSDFFKGRLISLNRRT